MGVDAAQEPLLRKPRQHSSTGLHAVHPLKLDGYGIIHRRLRSHHIQDGQPRALCNLKVVGIMGRGHLHHPGPELTVHVGVGNHGDRPARQGKLDLCAHQRSVAGVFGVHRNPGVPQHRFRTRRGHGQDPAAPFHRYDRVRPGFVRHPCRLPRRRGERIAQVMQMPRRVDAFRLFIGEGSTTAGAPVDDVLAAIDEPLLVKLHKDLTHSPRQRRIQRETRALPVAA